MPDFRQDLREDFAHIVTVGEHEEIIVYYPLDGGQREIRAQVEPDETFQEEGPRFLRIHRLEVTFSKDQFNAVQLNGVAAGHGGVAAPQRGDKLWRKEYDPETRRYSFTGFVIEDLPHAWTLEFKEWKVRRSGNDNVIVRS